MTSTFKDHQSYSEAILLLHNFIQNLERVEHNIPEKTTIDMKNDCMELYKHMKHLNEEIKSLDRQKTFYYNMLWKHYHLVQGPK
tara:strand:- start:7829 stop:8080 length:252 start_codon:yes stop_codon:yes gene_type:complete